ncbi:MAG: hypothetical protein WDA00_02350 [Eubacteriales bacterium]
MKHLFHFGLYREGLKRLRTVGLISAILCLLANLIVPLTTLILYSQTKNLTTTEVPPEVLPIEILGMSMPLFILLVPFIILSIFNYLNDRAKSDFYHAIPYRRSCVYSSFLLAALSWIWGIVLLSLGTVGVLYAVNPMVVFSFGNLLLVMLVYLIAGTMMAGFTALAMTLTGTATSNFFVLMLLLFAFRLSAGIFVNTLADVLPIFDIDYSIGAFLQAKYFLPLALLILPLALLSNVIGTQPVDVYTNGGMLLYSALVSLLLLGLGAWVYIKRRSEMAGKSAPNRALQHVFRCAFALPLVFLAMQQLFRYFYVKSTFFSTAYLPAFVALLVLSTLVYFFYELLTTRRWRRLLSALKVFPILLVCAGMFAVGVYATRQRVLQKELQASDISAVSLYEKGYSYSSPGYGALKAAGLFFSDPDLLALVAQVYDGSITALLENKFLPNWRGDFDMLLPGGGGGIGQEEAYYRYVAIKLKSGRTIGRYLKFTAEQQTELESLMQEQEEYLQAALLIPIPAEVLNVWAYAGIGGYYSSDDAARFAELWAVFYNEYQTLTTEQKQAMRQNPNDLFTFNVSGVTGTKPFSGYYGVPATMKQTIAAFARLLNEKKVYGQAGNTPNLTWMEGVLTAFAEQNLSSAYKTYCQIGFYTEDDSFFISLEYEQDGTLSTEKKALWAAVAQILLEEIDQPFDGQSAYVLIDASFVTLVEGEGDRGASYGSYVGGTVLLPLSADSVTRLQPYIEELLTGEIPY